MVSTLMGSLARHLYPQVQVTSFVIAGSFLFAAAIVSLRLQKILPIPLGIRND